MSDRVDDATRDADVDLVVPLGMVLSMEGIACRPTDHGRERTGLVRLDVGRLDNLRPLLGFVGDELPEIPRGAGKRCVVQVDRPRPQLWIGESRIERPSTGVFLGAPRPLNWLASYPGTNSPMVGMAGSALTRTAVVTASARSVPAWMYASDGGKLTHST